MPGPASRPLGEVYLAVERTPIMRLSRSLSNRSWEVGAYGAIYRANLKIARAVQEKAVENLRQTTVRPAQSTGTLERAIGSPDAIYADGQRIVIGVADYLDAQARYWRAVESGAPRLLGRIVYGYWTNAPRSNRGRVAIEGPRSGVATGRPLVLEWDTPPFNQRRFFSWVIEHPTQAHWFFLNAWDELGRSGFLEATYREEFRTAIGPNGQPIDLPARFQAYHGRPVTSADFRI